MSKVAVPLIALVICYGFFFVYVSKSYDDLPASVATHFDLQGQPDGWMSRESCVAFTLGLGLVMPAFIVVVMAGASRIPVSFINVPHRDYWLAPKRKQAAVAILQRYSLWFACMNVLFVTGLHWLTVQANQSGLNARHLVPHLSGTGLALIAGGFVAGTVVWLVLLLRRFSKIS
jgi:uncharacterized membrane protein